MITTGLLISLAIGAYGHGYMTQPPSRQYEAYEANGWPNEVAEYDPHGVAAGGMYSQCDGCSSREWYGPNPWSAPGTARHFDFVMGGSGGNMLGVCGASPSRDNDYNQPLPGHWGTEAKTTYKAGDIIDVAWCVSADHGGVPQFRLCDDEGLVSAVTTPGYKPTVADHEALEQCFQRGLLRCDGVDSNTCDQVAECDTYAADWEACADKGKYLHCSGGSPGERGCKNTAETCAHGILARYKLKIPESTKASSHTILSYRWDTYENNEVFVGCADIAITSDGDAAPVTPRPTPRPTKAADVATPRPTPRPTKDELDWDCAEYSESCHRIDHNNGDAFKALGTSTSWGSESVCASKDKKARWSTHWCPKQELTCTKANSCRRLDGKTGKMSTSSWNEAKCLEQGATARWTTMWCPDDAPAPTTPRPTPRPVADDGPCECRAHGDRADVTDEWCQTVSCDPAYASVCVVCDGPAPAPGPAPGPAPAPAPGPAPGPVTPRPTKKPTTPRPTIKGEEGPFEVIAGYVENWRAWDTAQYDSFTHLLYSFLTLDSAPNPDAPRDIQWDGQAIYETMTLADVLDVMQLCDGCAPWENEHNWMRQKIVALMDYCAANGKKFVWAFGGWSDLKRTISDGQVDDVVAMLVELLETVGGDGIDFDWEHLSEYKDIDPGLHAQQRLIVGKVIVALKDALVAKGMGDRIISFTPRYNAFWDSGAYGSAQFRTDGEGIDVVTYVVANSAYGVDAIDYVHYMMCRRSASLRLHDINAQEGFPGAPEQYFIQEHYDAVIESSLQYIPASKMVIGFEPGLQAYTGVSGGVEHEKSIISYLNGKVGGIMFWAVNEGASGGPNGNGQTTGENSVALANYAAAL